MHLGSRRVFLVACILNIETSTDVCSVAVSEGLSIVWHEEVGGMSHAEQLPRFVQNALYHLEREGLRLDAVAVSSGPGSYTGLRIGVSTAKGVCYALDAKLIGVPTLDILSVPVLLRDDIEDDALLCPMLDARRMEVYAQIVDKGMNVKREVRAEVVEEHTYDAFLRERKVYFFGNGANKCKEVITHPNAHFIDDIVPLAFNMQPLADRRYLAGKVEDVAYFTPYYLKEFQTTTPKDLLLQ